ncbi:MAG: hypothetical protein ACRBCT_01665 [Alphaproteobacteria bacterium]
MMESIEVLGLWVMKRVHLCLRQVKNLKTYWVKIFRHHIIRSTEYGDAFSLQVMVPNGDTYNLKRLGLFAKDNVLAGELYEWLMDTIADVRDGQIKISEFPVVTKQPSLLHNPLEAPVYEPDLISRF